MTIGIGSQELNSLRARCASLESRLKDEVSAHACTTALLQEAVGRAESEEKLFLVLENMPVMMNAFDDDGVCVAWNLECERITGYSAAEMIGNPDVPDLVMPDPVYRARMMGLWPSKQNNRGWEVDLTSKDGRRLTIAWSNISERHPVPGWAMWAIGIDVTESNRALGQLLQSQEALHKSEEILRLFMESATDSFAILDQNLNFVEVNRATARLYGIRKEDFVGKNIAELTPETKTSGRYEQYLRVIRTGEPFHAEVAISPPGAEREKRLSGTAFRVGAGLGLVAQDVTEQRHAEELLRSAKEEAELANRTKSEFLANMTHELRTPLNAIIGFSQVLERGIGGAVTDKQREYLKDIESSGNHLLGIISDILDLSKFELGAKEILDEQVDLAETISGSLRLVRDRLDTAGLTFQAQELKAVPLLRGDKRRLKQVLLNLLSNAIKFTNRGGSVTISGKTAADGSVCLKVTDSGIGMTPSDIEKSLTPFGQVESGLARNYEGTGLGLPISKSIMEAHGGKLEIESEPGEGTTVRLIFPADRIIHVQRFT